MTCREKLKTDFPHLTDEQIDAKIQMHCPHGYSYVGGAPDYCVGAHKQFCEQCWDREVQNKNLIYAHIYNPGSEPIAKVTDVKEENGGVTIHAEPIIKDSGDRTQFETGAVRDMHYGKGDMVSLPSSAILRLSKHYENGALKYGRWNYTKGIPVSSFLDSALRHLFKYLDGWDDEDHLSAAAFNILGAMEMESNHKEMIDLPNREGKNCFEYPR